MTTAQLGFAIDSSQAAGAASDLDRLIASSGKAEQAATKVSLAATKASRSFADVSPALDKIVASLSRLEVTASAIDQRLAAMAKGAMTAASANRALAESTNIVLAAQSKGNSAAAQATIAIDRQRAAVERLATANQRAARAPSPANQNRGGNGFQTANIAAQFQDIGVTAAMGSSPLQIALQQGTQLSAALGGGGIKQTVSSLGAAFAAVFNWQSLLVTGAVAATAAGIQYFMKAKDGALSLEDALKANAETLDLIKDRYGELAKVSASVTSVAGDSFVLSDARTQQIALNATLRQQLGGFLGATNDTSLTGYAFSSNSMENVKSLQNLSGSLKQFSGPVQALLNTVKTGTTPLDEFNQQVEDLYTNLVKTSSDPQGLRGAADAVESLADAAFSVTGKFKPFQDAINVLKVQGVDGLAAFADQVHRIGEEKGISKLADELISKGGDIVKLAQQAETLRRTLQAIDREDTRPGLRDRNDLNAYLNRRSASLSVTNGQFLADQQLASARTYAERNAAIEAQVRARATIDGDKDGGLQARVERALEAERNRQAIEQRDASLQRSQGLDKALSDQQNEIDLIGKTGGAATALRREYELTSEIRLEAARNGTTVDQTELNLIQEKTKALAPLCEPYDQAAFATGFETERKD
ncbi:phage tail length tape measure family protein [Rhizobium sp. BK602]|uniref:phage tail length tape measure family protein n=1 Tax=Rhizobium sp. BK602 TaxID=2586986 RepID=UPI00161F88FD|nr:phage tail length tape measure family protein [Rhizobium sp. BK602]MBB3610972.1 hypothetical protein [Rhizobium sp. BK602]